MTGWFTRPVGLACGFLVASLLVLAGLGWATFTALEAEAGQQAATARADRAGRERLALWRLDGFVLPVVGRENARPFDDYAAPTSPLRTDPQVEWARLHLQLDPEAGWSSPQVGAGGEWCERLEDVRRTVPVADAVRLFGETPPAGLFFAPDPPADPSSQAKSRGLNRARDSMPGGFGATGLGIPSRQKVDGTDSLPRGEQNLPTPAAGGGDFALRQNYTQSSLNNTVPPVSQRAAGATPEAVAKPTLADETREFGMAKLKADAAKDKAAPPPGVHLGPLRAVWVSATGGDRLFLARPVQVGPRRVFQAVWLDWPQLQAALAAQVADLLPAAVLHPVTQPAAPERAMTALPVDLDPGPLDIAPVGWTPLRTGLALAWAATLLALAAVAAGGRAVVALADRRVRFVSAVTHELRTPLTSLRLYLDMLAGGLVTDPAKRQEYLVTLAGESDRLHRLIENVLDFARLERRSVRANCAPTPVADLLAEVSGTWADRLATDGKVLVVTSTVPPGQTLRTNPRMAGQILANLVDNARKYSRGAADPRVWVWARPGSRGRVRFEVEDRGPGVPDRDRAGLFRAFRRGADVEAVAGGAGLGLALAAQWAGLLGGTLSFHPADGGVGACFRLELPGGQPVASAPAVG